MTCTLNARNLRAFSVCAFNQVTGKLLGPVEARSWASCLVWGKLGSISNSLFDPAVSDPDSHIMQMDGAIYSC